MVYELPDSDENTYKWIVLKMHIYFKHPSTTLFFAIFLFPLISFSANLSWESNRDEDIRGYLIYYGEESGKYTTLLDVGNVTEYQIVDLKSGKLYYFILSAYDSWGNESIPTPELTYYYSPRDTITLIIQNIEIENNNTLIITFSEPVESQSVEQLSHYRIIPPIKIYESVIDSAQTKVILHTAPHQNGNYEIIVSNIMDMAEIPNKMEKQTLYYTFQNTPVPSIDIYQEKLEFSLSQNYPNPFNPETAIKYSIDKPGHVQMIIYNSIGRIVNVLLNQYIATAGRQSQIIWDGKDSNGNTVSSGIYLYQIRQDSKIITKQMTLMR